MVQRSIATGLAQTGSPPRGSVGSVARVRRVLKHADATAIGLFFVTLALGVYCFSNPSRSGWYNHFVWQADAFLNGRFLIEYPVNEGPFTNGYMQDVMPVTSDMGLLPFPPLPALLLMPFVAIFGLATDSQLVGVVIGAINVGLAWRLSARLTRSRAAAALATMFFAFGTVHWYASMLSTTWFLAHVVAITFVLLGITLAIDAERVYRAKLHAAQRAAAEVRRSGAVPRSVLTETFEQSSLFLAWFRRLRGYVDPLQFMAGFVFGIGALARLPILSGAPFFLFVGGGGTFFRRGLSAGLGAFIPLALLLTYNIASTGHLFNPAYEHLYQTEYLGYLPAVGEKVVNGTAMNACPIFFAQDFCAGLEINRSLGIEDLGHVPMNALIMLAWTPIAPVDCSLSNLGACAGILPDQIGMSILLTSPAYLLALPILVMGWRRRLVAGSALAVGAIALLNLMHFSQGWVQFGYRFSNDFVPFALVLVTLGIARLGARNLLVVALVAASIIINAWGVFWGVKLGW